MEQIFLADRYADYKQLKIRKDSINIYSSIFAKYSYTPKDFEYSIREYLNNPDKFIAMMEKAKKDLNARVVKLRAEQRKLESLRIMEISNFRDSLYFNAFVDQSIPEIRHKYQVNPISRILDSILFNKQDDSLYKAPYKYAVAPKAKYSLSDLAIE